MQRRRRWLPACGELASLLATATAAAVLLFAGPASSPLAASEIDLVLNQENTRQGVAKTPLPAADDLAFLRRIYVDLVSRIPTDAEIREFESWPASSRRDQVIDKLMQDPRFVDRLTIFFEDMLRLRTNAAGGAALITFVHQSLQDGMPYDELCRRLLVANGKAGRTPEVGFILGDDADPMAMASVTAQVFLGTRIGCAQCHDHPFDVWKREDFYGLAAYFGKTRRVESQLTRVIYTTEVDQSVVLWPPDGDEAGTPRKPMKPRFPFPIAEDNGSLQFLTRLAKLRTPKETKTARADGPSVDDLLADADVKVKSRTASGGPALDLDAKKDIRKIDIQGSLQSQSELRKQLAELVTNPRNRYFARNIVNRMWKEFIGRGFVEPVDDFRQDNQPSHPATLDYLADEFVARGYDLRWLVSTIVRSDVYRRARAPQDLDDVTRQELEVAFLATPMKRMLSESLYDSIVTAGHLFEYKHPAGANEVTTYEKVRVPVTKDGKPAKLAATPLVAGGRNSAAMPADGGAMNGTAPAGGAGYGLEDAIELDFKKALDDEDEVAVEQMRVMSREELEAERMMMDRMRRGEGVEYVEKTITRVVDANPKFNSSLRMESPAPQGHFLRVFGQPTRQDLGESRDESATMRQALMMLNGRLTHEASRVGPLEPVAAHLQGEKVDVPAAIRLVYREILTRAPSADELSEAREIVAAAATPVEGMSDLRWVLLNCNEFRFLP
ncbi:MAG: DUF1553 domain-containing protein [Pirellulales bacterium]